MISPRDQIVPKTFRQYRTSIEKRKKHHNSDLTKKSKLFQDDRPYTTSYPTTSYPTTSYRRPQSYSKYRNLENVEQQLSELCGPEFNHFTDNKIKNMTRKFNQQIFHQQNLNMNSTILSNESRVSQRLPRNVRQMKICELSYPVACKIENVVGQPFFINAKQKLSRMIARKQQNTIQYKNLQFKVKQIQADRVNIQKQRDRKFQNPESIIRKEWDSEWKNQNLKQVTRYRMRLSIKHRKKMNNFTVQW